MAASYPAAPKSFTALNAGDTIQDTDVEAAYDEVTAMQQALLTTGLAHHLFPDATTRTLGTASKPWGTLFASLISSPPATTTATGTQNDVAVSALTLRCNNASALTITGFAAGVDGQLLHVVSVGAGQVDFAHQNTGSAAANRLINFATSGNTSLAAGVGTATFVYDATTARWRLVAHEQGAWITPTFAAGNFTAIGTMTWTVGAGDVVHNRYVLRGRTVTWELTLDATTVGGVLSTELRATIPGGFTANGPDVFGPALISDNGATRVWAVWEFTNATFARFYVAASLAGNWSAATDATRVYAVMTFEVT